MEKKRTKELFSFAAHISLIDLWESSLCCLCIDSSIRSFNEQIMEMKSITRDLLEVDTIDDREVKINRKFFQILQRTNADFNPLEHGLKLCFMLECRQSRPCVHAILLWCSQICYSVIPEFQLTLQILHAPLASVTQ